MANPRQVSPPSLPARFISSHFFPHSRMRACDAVGSCGGACSTWGEGCERSGAGAGAGVTGAGAGAGSPGSEEGRGGGVGVGRVCAAQGDAMPSANAKARAAAGRRNGRCIGRA